jgi:hypothetical protein
LLLPLSFPIRSVFPTFCRRASLTVDRPPPRSRSNVLLRLPSTPSFDLSATSSHHDLAFELGLRLLTTS